MIQAAIIRLDAPAIARSRIIRHIGRTGLPVGCLGRRAQARYPGLRITIDKHIPMGAGLGGGSSDAASTLKGLAALLPGFVDNATLSTIAASIGSDVPFFLGSACAAVTGRGELLSPVAPRDDYALVLVYPGFSISTRDAYARLDEFRNAGAVREASFVRRAGSRAGEDSRRLMAVEAPSSWRFRNDFYDALGSSIRR